MFGFLNLIHPIVSPLPIGTRPISPVTIPPPSHTLLPILDPSSRDIPPPPLVSCSPPPPQAYNTQPTTCLTLPSHALPPHPHPLPSSHMNCLFNQALHLILWMTKYAHPASP
jgi:hypothetical protein